jgi:hypothetical protein
MTVNITDNRAAHLIFEVLESKKAVLLTKFNRQNSTPVISN